MSLIPNWSVHETASVAACLIFRVDELVLEEHAQIGFGSFLRHLRRARIGPHARIGRGISINAGRRLVAYVEGPHSWLELGEWSAVTWRHYIDCSGGFSIGRYSLLAGRQSVVLTHGVDIDRSVNGIAPVRIGDYCFIGTNCTIVAGVSITDRVVVGAGSVVTRDLDQREQLYAGTPASARKSLAGAKYFERTGDMPTDGHPDATPRLQA